MAQLTAEFHKIEVYAALEQYEPETHAQIMAQLQEGLAQGATLRELRARTFPKVEAVVTKRLPNASDDALLDFTATFVDELQVLMKRDPQQCYRFMFADTEGGFDSDHVLPAELRKRDLDASAKVIRTSAQAGGSILRHALAEGEPGLPEPQARRESVGRSSSVVRTEH